MKTLPVSSDVLPAIFCMEAENEGFTLKFRVMKREESKKEGEVGRER